MACPTVTYPAEFAEFPTLEFRPFGSRATRRVRIEWSNILNFIDDLFPPTVVSGGAIVIGPGKEFPGLSFLRAVSASVRPMTNKITGSDAFGENTYEEADVTIQYESPKHPTSQAQAGNDPVPFLTHRWSAGGSVITVGNGNLLWDSNLGKVEANVNASKIIPTIEHQITWPRLVDPPLTAIRDLLGKINDAITTFATLSIGVESLLFVGAELTRDIMTDGTRAWTLNYRFSERHLQGVQVFDAITGTDGMTDATAGWNHFWRNDTGLNGFYRLIRKKTTPDNQGSGYKDDTAIFTKGDLSRLFLPEPGP